MQLYQAFKKHQIAQWGIGVTLYATPTFWLDIILVYIIIASLRVAEKAIHSIWNPTDIEILAENEHLEAKRKGAQSQDEIELQRRADPVGNELLFPEDDLSYHRDTSAAENGEYALSKKLRALGGSSKAKMAESDSSANRWLQD